MSVSPLLRRSIRQVLVEWTKSPGMALDRIVGTAFREQRLGSKDRRLAGDLLFLYVRHFPLLFGARWNPENIEDLRLLDKVLDKYPDPETASSALLKLHENEKRSFQKQPLKHFLEVHGVPEFLMKEFLEEEWGAWHAYLHSSMGRAPVGLRRVSDAGSSVVPDPLRASSFVPGAFLSEESVDLKALENESGARFEIQDEHSQMIVPLLGVDPGMKVLDLCAGAGGKTLHIAQLMKGTGEIYVHDVSQRRLEELKRRAREAGIANIRVWNPKDGIDFDRILIDAPCSGFGTFRRTPERLLRFTESELESLRRSQRNLLDTAKALATKQTEILYVTCSVLHAENIDHFSSEGSWEPLNLAPRLESLMGEVRANEFLTLAQESAAYQLSRLPKKLEKQNLFALQWGPCEGSQVSGSLRGDAFFVALVKCRNHEGKAAGHSR